MAKDLEVHFKGDYLKSQFNLISRKLPEKVPDIEHWRTLMHKHQKLDVIFSSITIPMVCTYNSKLFKNHDTETQDYIDDFIRECKKLHHRFTNLKISTNLEVILMLLPIPDKDELNKELDSRLKAMQKI